MKSLAHSVPTPVPRFPRLSLQQIWTLFKCPTLYWVLLNTAWVLFQMGFLSHLLHVLENIVFLRLTVGELRSDRDPKLFYLQVLKLWMCGLSYWDVKVVAGGFSNCAIKHHLLEAKPHFAQLLASLLLYYNKIPFYWPNIYHTHTIEYQWTCHGAKLFNKKTESKPVHVPEEKNTSNLSFIQSCFI